MVQRPGGPHWVLNLTSRHSAVPALAQKAIGMDSCSAAGNPVWTKLDGRVSLSNRRHDRMTAALSLLLGLLRHLSAVNVLKEIELSVARSRKE